MLNVLGHHAGDVPIAEGSDTEAAVLLAHALEKSGLGSQAEQALVDACRQPRRFAAVDELIAASAPLKLCADSWPMAKQRLWMAVGTALRGRISPEWALVVVYAALAALVLLGLLIATAIWGFELAAAIVLSILSAAFAYAAAKHFRLHRRYLDLNARGEVAFARVVSVTQTYRQVKQPGNPVAQTEATQVLDTVIDTPDGLAGGTFTIQMNEEPPLGTYPCLYHPDDPGGHFRLRIGTVDA